jgi:Cu+-exporting ATPase
MNKTFDIVGMHCAGCAYNLTKAIRKVAGVEDAQVNYATDRANVEFDEKKIDLLELKKAVSSVGNYKIILENENIKRDHMEMDMKENKEKIHNHTAHHDGHVKENHGEHAEHAAPPKETELLNLKKKVIVSLVLFVITFIGSILKILPHEITFILATVVMFYSGAEFFQNTWAGLKRFSANMDTLIAMGTGAAYLYSTVVTFWPKAFGENAPVYFETATAIVALIILGRFLEARAKGKAGEAIRKLLELQAKKAIILRDEKETEIPINQVKVGDTLVIKPGAKVPVDGMILEGSSYLDESLVTGESKPVKKKVGDKVIGSTINSKGRLIIKATEIGGETILAKIVKMVEEAQASQAPIQKLADKISSIFVPLVIIIATLAFLFWFVVIGTSFTQALVIFITVLIISCPCALGLATPISVMVGTGKGAQEGILIKNAEKLQIAGKIQAVVFDKTGTLTRGKFEMTDIITADITPKWKKEEVLQLAASLEQASEHPIGLATVEKARNEKLKLKKVDEFEAIEGKGISGLVDGKHILIGTQTFLKEDNKVSSDALDEKVQQLTSEGKTIAYVAIDNKAVGVIAFADEPKVEAKQTVGALKKLGIDVWMISGDNQETAEAIAKRLGIKNVLAQVLPDQKAQKIKDLQKRYGTVAMVGDGVNDAPALAQADVGITMATGTDVAIEAGDITLVRGKVGLVEHAISLSKKTMTNIKQNLFWAFGYNTVLIPIAAGVLIPFDITISPIFASGAMAASSLSVVLNSLRLKKSSI